MLSDSTVQRYYNRMRAHERMEEYQNIIIQTIVDIYILDTPIRYTIIDNTHNIYIVSAKS